MSQKKEEKMKAFYSIIILVAALLVAQLVFTSKAYGEVKNVWTTQSEVERVTESWEYVEETFDTPYDYFTRCWGKDSKDAKDFELVFKDKKEKGSNATIIWNTDKPNDVNVLLFNNDGTFTTRRYHKNND